MLCYEEVPCLPQRDIVTQYVIKKSWDTCARSGQCQKHLSIATCLWFCFQKVSNIAFLDSLILFVLLLMIKWIISNKLAQTKSPTHVREYDSQEMLIVSERAVLSEAQACADRTFCPIRKQQPALLCVELPTCNVHNRYVTFNINCACQMKRISMAYTRTMCSYKSNLKKLCSTLRILS